MRKKTSGRIIIDIISESWHSEHIQKGEAMKADNDNDKQGSSRLREKTRQLFGVIDGETGDKRLVAAEDGKVLTKPEPREAIKNLPYLHPDEYW